MISKNKENEDNFNKVSPVKGLKISKNSKRSARKQSKYELLLPESDILFNTPRKSICFTERNASNFKKKRNSKALQNKKSNKLQSKEPTPKPKKKQAKASILSLQKELEGLRQENTTLKEAMLNHNAENQISSCNTLQNASDRWTSIQSSLFEFRRVFEKLISNKQCPSN